jgi:SAM-dependent methyltransferase
MHQTSLDKIKAFVEEYLEGFEDTELIIIDVGAKSYLNNPTYRFFFNKPKWKYLGLDLEAGDNVDIVVSDPYNWKEVPSDFADVIVSGQAFEHIEFPWLTIKEIFRVLKPGGICCIIAPSSGAEHKYPHDCWRFYPDGMKALGKWAGFKVVEIFTDWGLGEWQDTFAVFQKPFSNSAPFPDFSNKKVAERVYLEAIKTSPHNLQYYANAINILKSSGRLDEALRYATSAVSTFPQEVEIKQKLAELYLEKRLISSAVKRAVFLLRRGLINDENIRIVNNALKSADRTGSDIILSQIPKDVETLTQLAYLSESTNSYHLMQVCYGKLMKELPENMFFKAMFGLSHKALGDEETFRKIFKELLEYQLRNNILNRTTIIQRLINRFGYKNYLEIGVERGINFFQIEAEFKIAVDPAFIIPGGYQDTEKEKFHQMTSDEFFANPPKEILEKGLDIVFVDGLHTYEQSLRDVENALRYLSNNGIIVIHDCLSNSPVNAMPTYEEAKQHPNFEGNWTGEVYKTIIHLRALRDDLFIAVVNVDWGVGIVKKGNPEGMVSIKVDDIRRMSYDDFAKDKEKLLNLKPEDWFYEFIETKYSF